MRKLIRGIIDFRQNMLAEYRAKFAKLAHGQSPDTLFIACCDSRVVPNVFASTDPGDLFVVRNIGNLVPPYVSAKAFDIETAAAVEFSLNQVGVQNIIICGHSECAAMQAVLTGYNNPEMPCLNAWLEYGQPSYQLYQESPIQFAPNLSATNQLSQMNVIQQLEHLKTYPALTQRLENKQVKIHGWWFDLATADVHYYNPTVKQFKLIDSAEAEKAIEEIQ